jgi:hypothetical protein
MLARMRALNGQRRGAARGRVLVFATLTSAAAMTVTVAFAASSKTVEIPDPKGDVTGSLDLQRASLNLGADGRLRAVITFVDKVSPTTMLAESGPPGSVCVKIWTDAEADPSAMRPDRLACVTARSKDELRATVLSQTGPGLPVKVAAASVVVNKSERSLVIRVSQSSLGRPELIRFAVESTRPGCERVTCVDEAPDKGVVRRFRIRGTAA